MKITIYNKDNDKVVQILNEDDLMSLCDNDQEMYEDYLRFLRTHDFIKSLNEIWVLEE